MPTSAVLTEPTKESTRAPAAYYNPLPTHPLTPGFSPVTKATTAGRKNRFSGFFN